MGKNPRFENPPVIEAWIEFRFDLSEEVEKWDEEKAREFVDKYLEGFKTKDIFGFSRFSIDSKTGKLAHPTEVIFDRIRAYSEDEDSCVQAGRETLIYNQIKKEKKEWPEYINMKKGAFSVLEKYMEYRKLPKIVSVALHYRDFVKIPIGEKSKLELEDYFKVYPETPDEIGDMSAFSFSVQLPKACQSSHTILAMQTVPSKDKSDKNFGFLMDWHVISTICVESIDTAGDWIDSAHGDLFNFFKSAFTQRGLELLGYVEN